MPRYTTATRRAQILGRLVSASGGWVNGSDLATPQCGGSEGLRRLRELRAKHRIERRPHPDDGRTVHQYRLVIPNQVVEFGPNRGLVFGCQDCIKGREHSHD